MDSLGQQRASIGTSYDTSTKVRIHGGRDTAMPNRHHLGWLDGIYMGDVFHATYLKQFQPQNTTAWGTITFLCAPYTVNNS